MATRTGTTRTYSVPYALRTMAYVSVMILALGIVVGVVLGWIDGAVKTNLAAVSGWIKNIALLIGVIVLCCYSYFDAVTRNRTWFILWIVAVVLIVVFYILGLAI